MDWGLAEQWMQVEERKSSSHLFGASSRISSPPRCEHQEVATILGPQRTNAAARPLAARQGSRSSKPLMTKLSYAAWSCIPGF